MVKSTGCLGVWGLHALGAFLSFFTRFWPASPVPRAQFRGITWATTDYSFFFVFEKKRIFSVPIPHFLNQKSKIKNLKSLIPFLVGLRSYLVKLKSTINRRLFLCQKNGF